MRLAFVGEEDVIPEKATITNARKNDRTQLDELVDEPGVTYVFDRGYIDYSAFNRYCDNKIHFVTRLKSNAFVEPLEAFGIPQGSSIRADMLEKPAKDGSDRGFARKPVVLNHESI